MPADELLGVFQESLSALDPGGLVRVQLEKDQELGACISVLALGKSAVAMASAASEVLGARIVEALVVAPLIPDGKPESWMVASHPTPDASSERAGRALLRAARDARGQLLVLISGGGSALAAVPAPGLRLADKVRLTDRLYAAGAAIGELNIVRKHLSAIKGGGLAKAASVPVHSYYTSDVVGDDFSTIASGPTMIDPSTYGDAVDIVTSFLSADLHRPDLQPALMHLQAGVAGDRSETPKTPRSKDRHVLLAGLDALADEAEAAVRRRGHRCHRLERVTGPVHEAAQTIARQLTSRGMWIAGGETTVSLPSAPGKGGRAQQLALSLASMIRGHRHIEILVAGSDGVDGNSQAAGAIVDNTSYQRLVDAGFDPAACLAACNTDPALAAIGAQVHTGPTGINHADLIVVHVH